MKVIKCSNCDKSLMCFIPKENPVKVVTSKAKCCYCEDYSFLFDFPYGSFTAGIAKEMIVQYNMANIDGKDMVPEECDDFENKTLIKNVKMEDDLWTFLITKV